MKFDQARHFVRSDLGPNLGYGSSIGQLFKKRFSIFLTYADILTIIFRKLLFGELVPFITGFRLQKACQNIKH